MPQSFSSFSRNRKKAVTPKNFDFSSSEGEEEQIQDEEKLIKSSEIDLQSQDKAYPFNNNINTNFNLESSFTSNHEANSQNTSFSNRQYFQPNGVNGNSSCLAINTTTTIQMKNPIQDSSLVNSILNSCVNNSKNNIQSVSSSIYPLDGLHLIDNGSDMLLEKELHHRNNNINKEEEEEEEDKDGEVNGSVLKESSLVLKELDKDKATGHKKHTAFLKNRYKRFKKSKQQNNHSTLKSLDKDNENSDDGEEDRDQFSIDLITDISTSLNLPDEIPANINTTSIPKRQLKSKESIEQKVIEKEVVTEDGVKKFKSQKYILKSLIKQNPTTTELSKQDEDLLIFSLGQVRDDLLSQKVAEEREEGESEEKNHRSLSGKSNGTLSNKREGFFAAERRNMCIQNWTDELGEIILSDKLPYTFLTVSVDSGEAEEDSMEDWKDLAYRLHRLVCSITDDDGTEFLKYIQLYKKDTVLEFLDKIVLLKQNENKVADFVIALAKKILEKDFDIETFVSEIPDSLQKYLTKMKLVLFKKNKDKFKKGITGLYLQQENFITERYFE
ncbi:hypothetical protein HANVADRAFT_51770 [Hanseniaspora valbyensis NRRL Y-1626]|uniref:Uncharacterized protein n=1 Tax=Hanseniaspora valbyensis NRRL Y-1626 TaxID=766949 RepID=A0A1B7TH37_9ASCO|nr:hypothetical protein HANVADRAFT_51770 [Hanseniaspora valbyensis NRRL Y-1626]